MMKQILENKEKFNAIQNKVLLLILLIHALCWNNNFCIME